MIKYRNKYTIILVSIIALSLITWLSVNFLRQRECLNKEHIALIGGYEFPIIFEDGDYSKELLNIITNDINLVYTQLESIGITDNTRDYLYEIKGQLFKSNSFFYRNNEPFYSPDVFVKANVGDLLDIDGKRYFLASKMLINKYKELQQFHEKNKNILKELHYFLYTLNNIQDPDNLTNEEIQGYIHFINLAPEDYNDEELKNEFIGLLKYKFSIQSYLSFHEVILNNIELILCEGFVKDKNTDKLFSTNNYGLVHGRWHLVF